MLPECRCCSASTGSPGGHHEQGLPQALLRVGRKPPAASSRPLRGPLHCAVPGAVGLTHRVGRWAPLLAKLVTKFRWGLPTALSIPVLLLASRPRVWTHRSSAWSLLSPLGISQRGKSWGDPALGPHALSVLASHHLLRSPLAALDVARGPGVPWSQTGGPLLSTGPRGSPSAALSRRGGREAPHKSAPASRSRRGTPITPLSLVTLPAHRPIEPVSPLLRSAVRVLLQRPPVAGKPAQTAAARDIPNSPRALLCCVDPGLRPTCSVLRGWSAPASLTPVTCGMSPGC
ncbi:hypothetical protein NDU88_002798 [Pleurodeles waltl]|uniref:Uncharacterized protein n=1 Tax=Pleurodeles waltl TaxID=8319 RepID=A0AAV7UAW4_PLEWA|nr:hypothetical protein NDU88_002798 [Pleurodeles waltl]